MFTQGLSLMLDNISLFTHLHTLEEAFLSFVLVASFGPKIEDQYKIPRCNIETHSYFAFGLDAFTKLMVREPYNRSLIQGSFEWNFEFQYDRVFCQFTGSRVHKKVNQGLQQRL